jgi:hypothetical protein
MKSILDEIRRQPDHIREVFMWVFVVIIFSVVGFAWFRSTEKQFVALLNPDQAQEQRILAEKNKAKEGPSPFAMIGNSFSGLKASIAELFLGIKSNDFEIRNEGAGPTVSVPPQELPISGEKIK